MAAAPEYWRLMRLFDQRQLKVTVFAIGMAIERNAEVAIHASEKGHEICCHGWRWYDYQDVPRAEEREHIDLAVRAIERITGQDTGRLVHRPNQ